MRLRIVIPCLFLAGCLDLGSGSKSEGPEVTGNELSFSWTVPTRYEDESQMSLEKIDSYYIYWGSSPEELGNREKISGNVNSYSVQGIPDGEYYFAIAVETVDGDQSLLSNIVNKSFP